VFPPDHATPNPQPGRDSSHRTRRAPAGLPAALALLLLIVPLTGCGGTPKTAEPDPRLADEGRLLFTERDPGADDQNPGSPDGASAFTILLGTVPPAFESRPEVLAAEYARALGGTEVRVLPAEGDRPARLVLGRYADPGSAGAQADLHRVREAEVGGRRPFAGAVLAPESVPTPESDRLGRFDLRRAKGLHGAEHRYTLQIAAYAREDNQRPSPADLAAFRKAAEEAVERLRREGEQAFFYHGPNGSMVTVGLFNDGDLDTSVAPPIESRRLAEVRARHPHNLVNGRGVREVARGAEAQARLQESRLVLIPD